MSTSTENKRVRNKAKRDAEKTERKATNIRKVEETKKKDVWERMNDERAGIVSNDKGEEVKQTRVRKVRPEHMLSRRKGHRTSSASVCIQFKAGHCQRVKKALAQRQVADGSASYIKKKDFKKWKENDERDNK